MDVLEESDLDLSFTSSTSNNSTTHRTFTSSSSSARTSLTCLSFNESCIAAATTTSATTFTTPLLSTRRRHDPHSCAVRAATKASPDGTTLHISHLKLHRQLGRGNLGRVFLCSINDHEFALKVIDKHTLATKKQISHVEMESEILSMIDHPFLPRLYANLQVSHYTCFLIDYCSRGDLHSLLGKQPSHRFNLEAVRFLASEVLVALEYLHAIGVVYRDLKPENVLIREDGHIMLSDFDLCFKADVVPILHKYKSNNKKNRKYKWWGWLGCFLASRNVEEEEVMMEFVAEPTSAYSRSCVGTHEYLAPELVNGNSHGNGVDWWAFGVFMHELLYGRTPFKGASKEATLRNIASSRPLNFTVANGVIAQEHEGILIAQAKDLISRLLVKDPRRRLGCVRGAADIKRHPFFHGIKWPLIRTYTPPQEVRRVCSNRWKKGGERHCSLKAFSRLLSKASKAFGKFGRSNRKTRKRG